MNRRLLTLTLLLLFPLAAGAQGTMSYDEAVARLPERVLPPFWVGSIDGLAARLDTLRRADVRVIAVSPGGLPVHLVAYGEREAIDRRANFNSAVGAGSASHFANRASRRKPVVFFVGPVHGHETEGLTGLIHLIHIMETGRDLIGRDQSELRALGERCRLLIVPTGNPDGVRRFMPRSLLGMTLPDLEFWGQGTWADGTLIGWPGAKQLHPMTGDEVGFPGCYFNDAGVNPMHDEFFRPMSTEAAALLDVARAEAPDLAVSLHSHARRPVILRPAYVPLEVQETVRDVQNAYAARLEQLGLPSGSTFEVRPEGGERPAPFNLVSALYHASGAVAFTHECPHGLSDFRDQLGRDLSHTDIVDMQLALYETMLRAALDTRKAP
jgi:hypothetical protein